MPRRSSNDTRIALLEAAAKLIACKGLDATTEEIAEAAGTSHGNLFNHFSRKSPLLNELKVSIISELDAAIKTCVVAGPYSIRSLNEIWNSYVFWAINNREKYRSLSILVSIRPIGEEERIFELQYLNLVNYVIREVSEINHSENSLLATFMFVAIADASIRVIELFPTNAREISEAGYSSAAYLFNREGVSIF